MVRQTEMLALNETHASIDHLDQLAIEDQVDKSDTK